MRNDFNSIDLQAENAELRSRLAKREAEAKKLADAVMNLRRRPAGAQPELFIILMVLGCVGRLVLFAYIEGMGTKAHEEGLDVSGGFGGLFAVTLAIWALHEWRVSRWLMVAKAIILGVGLRIAVDLWLKGQAVPATALAAGVLIGVALPLVGWFITRVLEIVMHPTRSSRG